MSDLADIVGLIRGRLSSGYLQVRTDCVALLCGCYVVVYDGLLEMVEIFVNVTVFVTLEVGRRKFMYFRC